LSPLEDCYRPDLAPDDEVLKREHAAQARFLSDAGVDFILAETHNSIREAAAALRAAKATGLPVVVSLVTDGEGRLLSGETIEDAVAALGRLAPDALGVNCVPAARLEEELRRLAGSAERGGRPLAAYANLGLPVVPERRADHGDVPARGSVGPARPDDRGWSFTEELAPEEYANRAATWFEAGARIVGGCCGTTARHTRALRGLIDGARTPAQTTSIASPNE
jgi:methionine synthase I (cobalamin-dependent)